MPLALARSVDARVIAISGSLVGRSPRTDRLAALAARHLAKLHVALLVLLLVGGRGQRGRRRRNAAVRTAIALPLTIGAVGVIGRLADRQRPFDRQPEVASLVEHAPGRSFPSRHSACAAAMTTIALPAAPVIGTVMGLGALGLAVSRVYTGLHYPSEVLGGWIVGAVVGIIARRKELPRVAWI